MATDDTYLEDWSREGFLGDKCFVRRAHYSPDYLSADGPHAPRRLSVAEVEAVGLPDPAALPVLIAEAKSGLRISVARRAASMSYVMRNVECDELHFVQSGELHVRTPFGAIAVTAGEFVCLPRSVAYTIAVPRGEALTLVVESPPAMHFAEEPPDAPFVRNVRYPDTDTAAGAVTSTTLLLKSVDELTWFRTAGDPLAVAGPPDGVKPVWKIALADVPPVKRGAPAPFVSTERGEILIYTLSARAGHRPPIHVNADYDEVVYYYTGPGAWGAVTEPGTYTHVPKGVTHNGPTEDVPAGYLAWLLESRTSLRFTPAALRVASLMETGLYAKHPSAAPTAGASR